MYFESGNFCDSFTMYSNLSTDLAKGVPLKLLMPMILACVLRTRSTMDAIRNQRKLPREAIFAQYDGNTGISNQMRCVISDNMKLIVSYFKDEFFIELYDLNDDVQEMNNLAFEPSYRTTIERLLSLLSHHMQRIGDYLEIPSNAYDRFLEDYESLYT